MQNAYVYILGSKTGVLYVSMTTDLQKRLHEHKHKLVSGFSSKFSIDRLLFFEEFNQSSEAHEAENRIKGWRRQKKLDLIRTINPTFRDLSEDWLDN